MKAKLIYKGGQGSGHHGHAGIPGHQGGSAPSGSAGVSQEKKRKLSSSELDNVLSGTKYSSRTKGLAAYARESDTFKKVYTRTAKIAPESEAKALAIHIVNTWMNGFLQSSIPGFIGTVDKGKDNNAALQRFLTDDDLAKNIYGRVKKSTLANFNDAIAKIDAAMK